MNSIILKDKGKYHSTGNDPYNTLWKQRWNKGNEKFSEEQDCIYSCVMINKIRINLVQCLAFNPLKHSLSDFWDGTQNSIVTQLFIC